MSERYRLTFLTRRKFGADEFQTDLHYCPVTSSNFEDRTVQIELDDLVPSNIRSRLLSAAQGNGIINYAASYVFKLSERFTVLSGFTTKPNYFALFRPSDNDNLPAIFVDDEKRVFFVISELPPGDLYNCVPVLLKRVISRGDLYYPKSSSQVNHLTLKLQSGLEHGLFNNAMWGRTIQISRRQM